ncbi:DUF308 domain-containing protein [Furfurilactobacillus siliginis]|uniref:DUF308 domain-containing protein n=1 Tax=Furfurilactobacillus siliginis TaxID=348151 RepID=A0A0R2L102_9LACO|nr:DUF308 domain-containing protein [Furfurilactobacillus siliginis]KRN95394.1 hypothetical protein IV55_GL002038 [Furfurilactobacillus siliginis]GEK28174.1 hypothetical protein LSI01_04850 [Furfurilactobacillus siliginis]
MIFIAVFGGIALILAIFYLINSIQNYGTWKLAGLLLIVFALLTGYAVTNLIQHPTRPQNTKQPRAPKHGTKESAAEQSSLAKAASEFNPNAGAINGQTASEQKVARANAESEMTKQLSSSFENLGTISFDADTKTYTVHPTNSDTVKALTQLEQTPEDAKEAHWSTLADNLQKSSKNISQSLKADYTIALLSPDQDGKVLFSATNGNVTTDFTK